MVFESVLVDILNRYLKPYVKKLDTSQLKLGVWKGHAQLEKLELKEDLFSEADLDVPLRIKASHIGKLEMHIPWKKLTKDPLVVTIDEVYVILGPKFDVKYDPKQEATRVRKEKEKQIEKMEEAAKKKKQHEKDAKKGKKKKKKDSDKPDTFTEKMVAHLMKNLLVKVRDIHVRYEDAVTNPGTTIAAGVTLHSLELKSTDANWKPTIVRETATLIYKLLELNCFGLYLTTYAPSLAKLPTEEMREEMRDAIARPALDPPPTNEYLMMPMTATAKLQLHLKPGVDLALPQLLMNVECEDIIFSLQERQFKSLMNTMESYDRNATNQRFLKYKPLSPLRENRRSWWVYVITAVLEEDVKRRTRMWSWKHIKQHRESCQLYQQKYRDKLQSLSPSSSLLHEIQELEERLDVFNIMLCRKQAKRKEKYKPKRVISPSQSLTQAPPSPTLPPRQPPPSPSPSPSQLAPPLSPETAAAGAATGGKATKKDKKDKNDGKKKKGFFSNLRNKLKHGDKSKKPTEEEGGGRSEEMREEGGAAGGGDGRVEVTDINPAAMLEGEHEKEEFYKAIGYSEEEDELEFPKEYIAHKVFVNLNSLTLQLTGKKELGNLVTRNVKATVFNRPSAEAVSVSASVGSIEMTGIPHGPEPTIILSSHTGNGDTEGPLVDFQLEMNPIDRDLDVVVKAALRPIQLTYDEQTVDGLIDAFKVQKNIHLQELTTAASASWDQLKTSTAAGVKDALKNRKRIELDVKLQSPYLIIPEKGIFSNDANLVVMDLGKLTLFGSTTDPKSAPRSPQGQDTMSQYYDKFTVRLEGMQVLVAKPGEDWYASMRTKTGSSSLHILDPTGFEIQLMKSIVDDDAYLPSLRIEGILPRFEVKISDDKLASILKVVTSLELPPPSLVNRNEYYDKLPAPSIALPVLGHYDDTISLDTVSIASFGDDEDEGSEEWSDVVTSYSPLGEKEGGEEEDISRHIFTDVSIKVSVKEIAVKLSQREPDSEGQKLLLDILVSNVKADVTDRKWDTQGSVSIGDVAIMDYIMTDSQGKPTYLLKTESLTDGNFITTRFVTVSRAGLHFAEHYTGLQDSVSAQLSLVKITLQRQSLSTLLHFGMALKPAIYSKASKTDESNTVQTLPTINPKDVTVVVPKQDFHFEAMFEGVELALAHQEQEVVHTDVKGFTVKGKIQGDKTTVSASMEDVLVTDTSLSAVTHTIVSKADKSKEMITLYVENYNIEAKDRLSHDLQWVDTSLKAEIQRINVNLDTQFLGNLMEFVKNIKIDWDAIEVAAKATAGTATATATAIRESTKSAFRFKMDVTLHAPLIIVPYRTKTTEGEIYVDLGDFRVCNGFWHGSDLMTEAMEMISISIGKALLDRMEIKSTSIQIYRKSHQSVCSLRESQSEAYCTILEPLEFTAHVTRILSSPTMAMPKVDVHLPLDHVKFHLHEEDVKALITIALTATKIGELMSPPKKAPDPVDPPLEVCKSEPTAAGQMVPPSTQPTKPRTKTGSRPRSGHSFAEENFIEVRLQVSLKSVSLDLTSRKGPLFKASTFGLWSSVQVFKYKVEVKGSVDSLSVVDMDEGARYSKLVSLAEGTNKVSSFKLMINLDDSSNSFERPLGEMKLNIAQVQLVLVVPFVLRMLKFIQHLHINPNLIMNATKAAQGGASAVTEYTLSNYKHFKFDVVVHAPVLFLPLGEDSAHSIMVDLGQLEVKNTLRLSEDIEDTDRKIGVDEYTIKLTSFKISRTILSCADETCLSVAAERVLLQPFHITLSMKYNISSWYTSIPTVQVDCTMGELKIYLGQEDLERVYNFALVTGEKLTEALSKGDGKVKGAIVEGLTSEFPDTLEQTPPKPVSTSESEEMEDAVVPYKKLLAQSSLSGFELRLFQKEPPLTPGKEESMQLSDEFALASLQLVGMELTAKMLSNDNVEVNATMKDIALCDQQKHRQQKRTGNRVIQHYTSNPLHAYVGKLDKPIVEIGYMMRQEEHSIFLKAENLLVLSDVEFLKAMAEYFTAIFNQPTKLEDEESIEGSVQSFSSSVSEQPEEKPLSKTLPKITLDASIQDFRVALIEEVETEQPQALSLKASAHFHVKLNGESKQASMNIVDLGIATTSFFDLDKTTSWVLLPCSLLVSMQGPLDKPAMDINALMGPVRLTLSPPVVRLIAHAVKTLTPQKKPLKTIAPSDLWEQKQLEDSKLWFLSPVHLHKAPTGKEVPPEEKGEVLTLSIEAIEVILESESTQKSQGHPLLAVNASAVLQLFEWTGELSAKADFHCEASYYSEKLSVWEPLLEPLETKNDQFKAWLITAEVSRSSSNPQLSLASDPDNPENPDAKFSVVLSSTNPLQITVTRTSLNLLKSLAEAYSKEYGKKVEGNVQVKALTGAPFTIVNKFGTNIPVYVQPGPSTKLRDKSAYAKIPPGESVDLLYKKELGRQSYASLISRAKNEYHSIEIAVGKTFQKLTNLPINIPGVFYYGLLPKEGPAVASSKYGIVLDVAVTGTKKTITLRSPLQFQNHLQYNVEIQAVSPSSKTSLTVLKPNDTYPIPSEVAYSHEFYVNPADFGFEPEGPPIMWLQKPGMDYVDFKSRLPGDEVSSHVIRVSCKEENYKIQKRAAEEDFPHHIFHLYPPLIVQNLLPSDIFVGNMNSGCPYRQVKPGEFVEMHDLDLEGEPLLTVSVSVQGESSLQGKVKLSKKPREYTTFVASNEKGSTTVELGAHTEVLSYHKVAIYSPFWMINKTGLTLEYKEGLRPTVKHPPSKKILLYSTKDPRTNIQLGAFTPNGSHTDWTKSFTLSAVGTSGTFCAQLGEHTYHFGVEIRLSQFTLTKLVVITPYYLLVNQTEVFLQAWERNMQGNPTSIPPGELVSFWPFLEANKMVLGYGNGDRTINFRYKNPDFIVLKLNDEHVAICVEIQVTDSATIVTFAPYYHGCVPVQIINHFPDLAIKFWQDANIPGKNLRDLAAHTVGPGSMKFYTWDAPHGKRLIRWEFLGAKTVSGGKPIDIVKDGQDAFKFLPSDQSSATSLIAGSLLPTTSIPSSSSAGSMTLSPPPRPGITDSWLSVDESFSEELVSVAVEESAIQESTRVNGSPRAGSRKSNTGGTRGFWRSFIDGIQRVVVFTPNEGVIDQIKAENSYSQPLFEVSLSLQTVGLSLVDNQKKRELAYIALSQSGLIWQVEKAKRRWKTLNSSTIELLEQAYQRKELDIRQKDLAVNLATMEMFSPVKGKLRRTHHNGFYVKFAMSEKDYSLHAKIGHVQVDNQLPFSVYPQVLYPLPPPPTVASTTEPKPFVEASIILRKNDQSSVNHFKYVHVLIQKMAVNVDLGFILALVDFISFDTDPLLETENVRNDVEFAGKSLKETILPEVSKDLDATRNLFDVLHVSPIKICLSFNVRSVGRNKDKQTVGDRLLELFLHSLGVILTSVQETDMKFSCFHLEFQPVTGRGLQNLFIKHYRTQALFQLHTLIFGLDVLGNPVAVVRGVVEGTFDLFYEPFKGSVLGPEEFFEGLGIGLKSFFGGTVGGLTGAGARITGAFGDVFAKLTFDNEFIDKRQQQKTKPPRLGMKLGGFAMNVFEGVTGVVTQPVKGLKKEGAVGLLKGTGRGLAGLILRPTGGLIDLTSGTLDFVTRKTQIGDFEIEEVRPPRFIGRDGIITPYSTSKAIGTALLLSVNDGQFADSDYYHGHVKFKEKAIVLVTDRRFMLVEKRILPTPAWKADHSVRIWLMGKPVEVRGNKLIVTYQPKFQRQLSVPEIALDSADRVHEAASVINESYSIFWSQKE